MEYIRLDNLWKLLRDVRSVLVMLSKKKQFSFRNNVKLNVGSPHWKLPELFFEKKGLISAVQQLLIQNVD